MEPMDAFKRNAPAILLIFVGGPIVYYLLGIGCPIKFITGISCPGCGMCRAWAAVLSLDFAQAFAFHPLFFLAPLFPIILLIEPFVSNRIVTIALVVIGCAFIICWVIRLLMFFDIGLAQPPFLENNVVSVERPVWITWCMDAFSAMAHH